ncbi:MAG: transglycosylase SLT domain-containing protein [Pseudomonadota bacterium]
MTGTLASSTTRVSHLAGVFTLIFACFATGAEAASRVVQRAAFQAALDALRAGDRATFFAEEARIRNYVLHPHLRFELAMDTVSRSPWPEARAAVLRFAKAERDSELAVALVRSARRRLRDAADWQGVLDSADWPSARPMPCLELRARVALGRQTVLSDVDRLRWTARHWPADCEAAFNALLAQNAVSGADLWARLATLMDRGRLDAARQFFPRLSNADDALLQLWIDGHTAPAAHIDNPLIHANTTFNRNMARHFMSRWARRDPVAATRHIASLIRDGRYDRDTHMAMLRTVAIRAAVDYHPGALKLLAAIPDDSHTAKTRAWWVRSALRATDWSAVVAGVDAMPAPQRHDGAWRYWRAHALIELGRGEAGRAVLAELAGTRSYYGFLAADRLGLTYQLEQSPMPRDPDLRTALQARADVQQAREYWVLGLDAWAQRTWQRLARELEPAAFAELVTVTHDWGWHDRALAGNARTPYSADLTLRFPFAFSDSVAKHAQAQRLDPSWVYATARRESGFRPAVRSGVGAVGLMQLMPATARAVAAARGESGAGDLTNPGRNIQLGTHYLAQLRERFKGSVALTTAGYNAGPSRIKRWTRDNWVGGGPAETARWVETLPIDETRNYVQAVMAYATVYDWLANAHQDVRLTRRLGALPTLD